MGDIEILKSKRENPIVCHDGFLYTQHPMTVEKHGCVDMRVAGF